MHIVLVEPEIPQNTGNIARTCAATGSFLHLIKPLGFSLEDRYLKRAGLDYWSLVKVQEHQNFADLRKTYAAHTFYYASTKGARRYTDVSYQCNDFLVFGKETKGLPEDLINQNKSFCIRIPMTADTSNRSLNLANAVAVVIYEALRQQGFSCMI